MSASDGNCYRSTKGSSWEPSLEKMQYEHTIPANPRMLADAGQFDLASSTNEALWALTGEIRADTAIRAHTTVFARFVARTVLEVWNGWLIKIKYGFLNGYFVNIQSRIVLFSLYKWVDVIVLWNGRAYLISLVVKMFKGVWPKTGCRFPTGSRGSTILQQEKLPKHHKKLQEVHNISPLAISDLVEVGKLFSREPDVRHRYSS